MSSSFLSVILYRWIALTAFSPICVAMLFLEVKRWNKYPTKSANVDTTLNSRWVSMSRDGLPFVGSGTAVSCSFSIFFSMTVLLYSLDFLRFGSFGSNSLQNTVAMASRQSLV